ncbi:MAG: hypothetical protein GEU94_18270 [Micromonosporaceae bacterium]|nr:hypothetical protein [Micromonosporaceae bacterium]
MILAHGIGGRADLPVPLWIAVYGGALAVLISFLALTALWSEPKLTGSAAGRPLPGWLAWACDASTTRAALRALGLALFGLALAAAWLGPNDPAENPAPTWMYVWFWVMLAPLSALLGPVWRLLNPLRTLTALMSRVGLGRHELPDTIGYWPAVMSLLAFLWLELVNDNAGVPRVVAVFITGYAVAHLAAGAMYGERWFDRGDGFEAYSTLLGHLSPLGRRDDGRLAVRNPLNSLASLTPAPGLVAVIAVLLGSTGFDGLTRTLWWKDMVASYGTGSRTAYLLLGTAGLLAAIGFVLVSYTAATRSSQTYAPDLAGIEGRFAHSLLPIVLGYTVAHYFSFAVFQGQMGWLLATDPFGLGWDLLGTAGARIDYTVVSPQAIAWVQVGAIITGHVLGVVSAHDRAVAVFPGEHRNRGQYGLLAVMVAYTIGGITLIVGG